ncbi:DUF4250 domain-containing protein [Clostridium sp. MSJ-4]|uniref:DUF4250 domain-containing protein n=1 Tax=Clostridium simiarum TaxID=2841506 RepID=A0ABS6F4V3_9CLOT|nr:DUF4250 domain-containing protein [Clostridium simiarum]MBU5592869.1 DUF4250 domain-containing protein [Clostridium simiarum]
MDKDSLIKMDPYMLISILNMKLRDEFNNLEDLLKTYDLQGEDLLAKLLKVGYVYSKDNNQFIEE